MNDRGYDLGGGWWLNQDMAVATYYNTDDSYGDFVIIDMENGHCICPTCESVRYRFESWKKQQNNILIPMEI